MRTKDQPQASQAWLLAGAIALAALLRFWRLGTASLWLDEAASWVISRHPAWELLARNIDHGNPPLYYVALGGWMRLFGDSEAALRSLSALAGVLAVPAIYLLGRELWGRRVGLLAALLLAANPWHVALSREARQYPAVLLFGALSAWCLARALKSDRWPHWLGAALFAALAFYTHFSGALVPAFEAVWVVLAGRPRRAWVAATVLAALCLPGALFLLAPSFLSGGGYSFWQGYATPDDMLKLLNALFGKPVGPSSPLILKAAAALLLLAAVGVPLWLAASRERPRGARGAQPADLALSYFLVPVALFAAMALVKPIWQERYVFAALPGFVLLAAWALSELKGRQRAGLAAAALILTLAGLRAVAPHAEGGWRAVATTVRSAAAAEGTTQGEVLIAPPYMRFPFQYYYRTGLPVKGFPPASGPIGAMLFTQVDEETAGRIAAQAASSGTIFLIYPRHGGPDPNLLVARHVSEWLGPGRLREVGDARVFAFGLGAVGLQGQTVSW